MRGGKNLLVHPDDLEMTLMKIRALKPRNCTRHSEGRFNAGALRLIEKKNKNPVTTVLIWPGAEIICTAR